MKNRDDEETGVMHSCTMPETPKGICVRGCQLRRLEMYLLHSVESRLRECGTREELRTVEHMLASKASTVFIIAPRATMLPICRNSLGGITGG